MNHFSEESGSNPPASSRLIHHHSADVLIIGGGVAGCLAAISAKIAGAKTLVVEKYNIYSSGDAGTGEDHFLGILGQETWDTGEEFYRSGAHVQTTGPIQSKKRNMRYANTLPEVTRFLEQIGIPFKERGKNHYYRIQTFGQGHPYTIQYDGSSFKRILASYLAEQKIDVLNRIMITNIVTNGNRVNGAIGLDVRDGSVHEFAANSLVITAGETSRLYSSPSNYAFDSWHSPYSTGDGTAMAFRVGARVCNLEFLAATMCARGYSTPGTQAFVGMGCYLINSKGDRFMNKYHGMGERAPRAYLCWGIHSETIEGRGPVFIDARHLSDKDKGILIDTLTVDKEPFGDFLIQRKIDLFKEPMEVSVSEFHSQSGILVDEYCRASVNGLFAAGSCTGSNSVSRTAVEGFIAGRSAAAYASRLEKPEILQEVRDLVVSKLFQPLNVESGPSYRVLEEGVRQIMTKCVGFDRTDASMNEAIRSLNSLESIIPQLSAKDFHQLMRVLESVNIHTVAKLVTIASLERKERRIGGNLMAPRGDYQQQSEWENKIVVLEHGNAENDVRVTVSNVDEVS